MGLFNISPEAWERSSSFLNGTPMPQRKKPDDEDRKSLFDMGDGHGPLHGLLSSLLGRKQKPMSQGLQDLYGPSIMSMFGGGNGPI